MPAKVEDFGFRWTSNISFLALTRMRLAEGRGTAGVALAAMVLLVMDVVE